MATIEPSADEAGRTAGPVRGAARRERRRVGIVVANSNTRVHIAGLVFSLYRLLGSGEFAQLVIVDNASTDGSRELLEALHQARLIHQIANERQLYHGPALTQGISWPARRQRDVDTDNQLDYIWVLDSDVIVLRQQTVRDALAALQQPDVAAIGQSAFDPAQSPAARLPVRRAALHPASRARDPAPNRRARRHHQPVLRMGNHPPRVTLLRKPGRGSAPRGFRRTAQFRNRRSAPTGLVKACRNPVRLNLELLQTFTTDPRLHKCRTRWTG